MAKPLRFIAYIMQETINFLSVIDSKLKKSHHQKRHTQEYMTIKDKIQMKRNSRYPYAKAINFRQSMYKQYPKWLTEKDGFTDFMYKSYEKKLMSIPKICQKEERASEEKYFLNLYLQQIKMFKNLPNQVNEIILNNITTKYYKAGDQVYEQNDPNQFIGIIYVGSVQYKISKRPIVKQKNQVFLAQAFQQRYHPTIYCKDQAVILTLDHKLSNLINETLKREIEVKERDEILDMLKSPFFSQLHINEKKARHFYNNLKLKFYFQNQVIQQAGSENKVFYLLYRGRIQEQNHIYIRQHNKWPLPNNCWEVRAVYNSFNKKRYLKRFDFFGDQEILDNLRFRSKFITNTWTIVFQMPGQVFTSSLNQEDLKRLKKYKAQHTDVSYYDFEAKVRAKAKSTTERRKIVLKAINTSLVHKTQFSPKKMELIKNFEKSMLKKPFFEENTISY